MIRVTSNIPQVSARLGKLGMKINKGAIKTVRDATIVGKQLAVRLAAHKSGYMAKAIYRRTYNNGMMGSIISANPMRPGAGGYPYNMWINEVEGYEGIKPYRACKKKGTPAFMFETFKYLNQVIPQSISKNMNMAVKA